MAIQEENPKIVKKKKPGRPKGSKNKPKVDPSEMTPQKVAERLRRDTKGMAMHDTLENRLSKLAIVDKGGQTRGLVPNWAQQQLIMVIRKQAGLDLPVRIIIAKARQTGQSTIAQALMFLNVDSTPNYAALAAAHTDDSSTAIFQKAHLFHEMLPPNLRKPLDHSNKKELVYSSPHRSRFTVQTAGRKELGRSLTLQALHASELAFWPNADLSLLAVSQAIPNKPGTMVIIESTSNGASGAFYNRWHAAVKQQQEEPWHGYVPVFFSWLCEPGYRLPLRDKKLYELDEHEQRLREMGADDEQLNWRRMAIKDLCGGDLTRFQQEYPINADESFQVSGRPVFDIAAMARHSNMIRDGHKVVFARNHDQNVVAMPADSSHDSYWELWAEPTEYGRYTVGCDVAEGELADPMNVRSDLDYSAAAIYDRKRNSIIGLHMSRIAPDRLGEQLILAGKYFNNACVNVEVNGPGHLTMAVLRDNGYSNMFVREGGEDHITGTKSTLYGWRTTQTTRDRAIDDWSAGIRADSTGSYEDSIDLYSDIIVDQEQTFATVKRGPTSRQTRRESLSGRHDDALFACFLAYQAHLRKPMERKLIIIDYAIAAFVSIQSALSALQWLSSLAT